MVTPFRLTLFFLGIGTLEHFSFEGGMILDKLDQETYLVGILHRSSNQFVELIAGALGAAEGR